MSIVDISVIASNVVLVASALAAGSVWLWAALSIVRHTRSELRELSLRLDRLAGELAPYRARADDADDAAALADALDHAPRLGPVEQGPPA